MNAQEEWERPDREAVLRDNPLLDYCQERGLKLRRVGREWTRLCPLHNEETPSFYVNPDKNLWYCFGCGGKGNVIGLHAAIEGVSGMEAMCQLAGIEYHGGKKANSGQKASARQGNTETPRSGQESAAEELALKAKQRKKWPHFDVPSQAETKAIASLRGISAEGVSIAAQRGLLFTASFDEGRGWVITDSHRKNAQARRIDGRIWTHIGEKAWTLRGSIGALPIGLREALGFPNIALVEGGPDMLAAFHLAWCATSTPETLALGKGIDVLGKLGVVTMLGTSPIPEGELRHFKGKRVRIFADADEPGLQAEGRWWSQLEAAGARVEGYSFEGFVQSDGRPVKDLNDFALIDPDHWEAQRDAIEEAFSFSI
jgi:hypothetical protein